MKMGDDGPSVPPLRGGAVGALIRHSSAVSPQMLAVAAWVPWEDGVDHARADCTERAGAQQRSSTPPWARGLGQPPPGKGHEAQRTAGRRAGLHLFPA